MGTKNFLDATHSVLDPFAGGKLSGSPYLVSKSSRRLHFRRGGLGDARDLLGRRGRQELAGRLRVGLRVVQQRPEVGHCRHALTVELLGQLAPLIRCRRGQQIEGLREAGFAQGEVLFSGSHFTPSRLRASCTIWEIAARSKLLTMMFTAATRFTSSNRAA